MLQALDNLVLSTCYRSYCPQDLSHDLLFSATGFPVEGLPQPLVSLGPSSINGKWVGILTHRTHHALAVCSRFRCCSASSIDAVLLFHARKRRRRGVLDVHQMLRSTQDSTEIEYRKNAPDARSPPPVKTNWGQTLQLLGRAYSSRGTHAHEHERHKATFYLLLKETCTPPWPPKYNSVVRLGSLFSRML